MVPAEQIIFHSLEKDLHKLKIQDVSDDILTGTINGESGYHIYHVKMITELLLRELKASNPDLALSDEDIVYISIASSLHDIGKMQIPQSILSKPGALSPLEYDIVKKHSIFGETVILDAESEGVSDDVIRYAAQIAKNHHERIDGTGYPAGLHGDEIPLCAQVVSLADAITKSKLEIPTGSSIASSRDNASPERSGKTTASIGRAVSGVSVVSSTGGSVSGAVSEGDEVSSGSGMTVVASVDVPGRPLMIIIPQPERVPDSIAERISRAMHAIGRGIILFVFI